MNDGSESCGNWVLLAYCGVVGVWGLNVIDFWIVLTNLETFGYAVLVAVRLIASTRPTPLSWLSQEVVIFNFCHQHGNLLVPMIFQSDKVVVSSMKSHKPHPDLHSTRLNHKIIMLAKIFILIREIFMTNPQNFTNYCPRKFTQFFIATTRR